MEEELQRGMRQTPLTSQPPPGHCLVPERLTYIPGQEKNLQYFQPNMQHQPNQHPPVSPTWGNSRLPSPLHSSFPPPLPPPSVNHHSSSMPPLHRHNHPPPVFSTPPPPVPQRFQQPPSVMPHAPNIPYQAVLQAMTTPMESSPQWSQHNLPTSLKYTQASGPVSSVGLSIKETPDMRQEEEDLKWLKEFEMKVKSCTPPLPSSLTDSTTTTNRVDIKLEEVQWLVQESHLLTEQLCALEEELVQVSSTASEEEWDKLVNQAEAVKMNLNQNLKNLQDQSFIERTKTLLRQRRAKRKRVKRRKKELKLEKEQLKREREEKEAQIDAWRAKLQQEEESKRREESVKKEADNVLSEVRQKQSEAQKMLQLLEALKVLRQTRATQAAAQGQPKDAEAEKHFTIITEKITATVKKQLKEYKLEEQTLRVMMEESASHRSVALSAKGDASFARFQDSVRKLLFGSAGPHEDADLSLEMLIQRRHEWDQFVVAGDSPLASAVPLSWVLPPAQPHSDWAAFLKR